MRLVVPSGLWDPEGSCRRTHAIIRGEETKANIFSVEAAWDYGWGYGGGITVGEELLESQAISPDVADQGRLVPGQGYEPGS